MKIIIAEKREGGRRTERSFENDEGRAEPNTKPK